MERERRKWEEEKAKKEGEREDLLLGQPPCMHLTQPIVTQSQQMPGPSHANMAR